MTDNNLLWLMVGLALVAIAVGAVFAVRRRARMRRAALREQFGPEYDRAVTEIGSTTAAERVLSSRAKRVDRLQVRELSAADRARFTAAWTRIQAQFVDDPASATFAANELIEQVMRARGYPTEDFEQRVADLSVDHPDVVQHYRAAHALSDSTRTQAVSTEELRQAIVHFRVLFADLLEAPEPVPHLTREARSGALSSTQR